MACYRMPYINKNCYFTYGNIHKNALLGMLGALLGYGGYTQQYKKKYGYNKIPTKETEEFTEESYPEFFERLWPVKISILPKYTDRAIPRNMISFNNSTGAASTEEGGNLIVTEQVLERPAWEIAVLLDCEEAEKIKDYIVNRKGVFFPYLGRNDYPANISDISVEEAIIEDKSFGRLHCLWPETAAEENDDLFDFDECLDAEDDFYYSEQLPYGMSGWTNLAYKKKFIYCNSTVSYKKPVYRLQDEKRIVFY